MKEFQEVWKDIVDKINEDNTVFTLNRGNKNIVQKIIDEGLLVSTGKEPKLVTKEWVKVTWNTLKKYKTIQPKDISGRARFRSSFIMALLSQLDYVKGENSPLSISIVSNEEQYPYFSNSWIIDSETKSTKIIDKSCFKQGSGIPKDIRKFFRIENLKKGERKHIKLIYKDNYYPAYFLMSNEKSPRSRLFWNKEFIDNLNEAFPDYRKCLLNNEKYDTISSEILPKIQFYKVNEKEYIIDLLNDNINNIMINFIDYSTNLEKEVQKSRKDNREKRLNRLQEANKKPEMINTVANTFKRNPDVVAEVLERAKGFCERCKSPAPFIKASDGTPYLEVHHTIPLSEGGDDTVDNAVALCPNCHRELHFGIKDIK